MDKKMNNLFKQEEWIVLTLSNCAYQVNIYLKQLQKLKEEHPDIINKQEFLRFKSIFKYYKKHLIPAIQELAILEQKHLKLILKNPDPEFLPIQEEFDFHKNLMERVTLQTLSSNSTAIKLSVEPSAEIVKLNVSVPVLPSVVVIV